MQERAAVIFIPDDTGKTGLKQPLMLMDVCGSPLLAWTAGALADGGVERLFLVCHEQYAPAVQEACPAGMQVTVSDNQSAAERMTKFLSEGGEDEQVMVLTGPAVLIPGQTESSCAYSLNGHTMQLGLEEQISVLDLLHSCGVPMTGATAISSAEELYETQKEVIRTRLYALLRQGVQIWDLDSCYVSPQAQVGQGSVLMPGTMIQGKSVVGQGCVIGPGALLDNARVGDETRVNASQIYDSTIGQGATVGPFAYIRPNCVIGNRTRIGDFVELKNSTIGEGTKVSHLTYVGDSDVGRSVNFGCGTVTVNYNGLKKFRTTIGDNAFIGCNTNLVAPVSVGQNAYTGAGTTITEDVPDGALAIGRPRQVNKKDWVVKHRKK